MARLKLPVEQFDPMGNATGYSEPGEGGALPTTTSAAVDKVLNAFFRPDEKRYQLWPEKLVRDALDAPNAAMTGRMPMWQVVDGELHTSPEAVKAGLDVSALAGTGGLGGVTEGTLGATPFLRPALKYKEKIYKAPPGGQHLDALPAELAPEFQRMAMSGEDISHYNFGFMNHKGHFLDREAALKYAIDEGLMSPHDAKFGALTSTMFADSSKEASAIKSIDRPYKNVPDELMGFRKNGQQKGFDETSYPHSQKVKIKIGDDIFEDEIKGLNKSHALERAYRNWKAADSIELMADSSKPAWIINNNGELEKR